MVIKPVQEAPEPEPQPKNDVLSIISMASGISSFIFLPIIGAIAAIITGHLGLHKIKKSEGALQGKGMATTGLILGYLQVFVVLFIVVLVIAVMSNQSLRTNFFEQFTNGLYLQGD